MIIFFLEGTLFISFDFEQADILKLIEEWKEHITHYEPWLDDEDWEDLQYRSPEQFLEWFNDHHSGHLEELYTPAFSMPKIDSQHLGETPQ